MWRVATAIIICITELIYLAVQEYEVSESFHWKRKNFHNSNFNGDHCKNKQRSLIYIFLLFLFCQIVAIILIYFPFLIRIDNFFLMKISTKVN